MSVPKPKALRDEVLTIPEIAWISHSKRGTVERWRLRNPDTPKGFPIEDDSIGSTPVWHAARVIAWLDETERPHRSLDEWREHKASGGFRRKAESLI